MGQKQNKIEDLFFENPSKEYYLRQISKLTKVPKSTVSRKLEDLVKKKIILRLKSKPYDKFISNVEYSMYKYYKRTYFIEKIYLSGFIELLVEKTNPRSIILFGSIAKGESDKMSDIDIFIESEEISLNLSKFNLGHKINLIFNTSLKNVSEDLRNNLLNGIKLYGMIKI